MPRSPTIGSPTSRLDLKADRWSNRSSFEVVEPSFIHQNFYRCRRTKAFTSLLGNARFTMDMATAERTLLVKEKEKLGTDKLIDAITSE